MEKDELPEAAWDAAAAVVAAAAAAAAAIAGVSGETFLANAGYAACGVTMGDVVRFWESDRKVATGSGPCFRR